MTPVLAMTAPLTLAPRIVERTPVIRVGAANVIVSATEFAYLRAYAAHLGQGCYALIAGGASNGTEGAEEYVSIAVLCQRIPYAPQTIRNLMSQGVLRRDVHYFKPRGRVIFKLSAVRAWIEAQRG